MTDEIIDQEFFIQWEGDAEWNVSSFSKNEDEARELLNIMKKHFPMNKFRLIKKITVIIDKI